jgi:hypothetical protein
MKKKNEESFSVNGENLLKKVKEIIEEGNVRRITIKDKDGKEKHTILDISDKLLKMTTKFMGMKVVYVMKRVD